MSRISVQEAAALLKRDLFLDGAGIAKKALEVLGRG